MRKYFLLCILLMIVMVSNGCILTLNSLFTQKDVVFDPALAGTWKNKENIWTIKPFDKRTGRYTLETKTKDQPDGSFYARLGTINGNRFLEIFPKRPRILHKKTFYGAHFIKLYSIWKVALKNNQLTLTPLSATWFDAGIRQKRIKIKYEKSGSGDLFISASTQELQDFISKYADNSGAFPIKEGQGMMIKFSREEK